MTTRWARETPAAGCWLQAAEATLRLGGGWIIEPRLVGWAARPTVTAGVAPGWVWGLTLRGLLARICVTGPDRWRAARSFTGSGGGAATEGRPRGRWWPPGLAVEVALAGPAELAPMPRLALLLAPCWAAVPDAALAEAIALLPGPARAEAQALFQEAFPGLDRPLCPPP